MRKAGGGRNFGWGKQMEWAGKQALRAAFDGGHYGTVARHAARWRSFCQWARERGVRDLRQVTRSELAQFAAHLVQQTKRGMSIGYAKNQLTSVNVALESLRGDRAVWVKPGAAAVIFAHPHPSGVAEPSSALSARRQSANRFMVANSGGPALYMRMPSARSSCAGNGVVVV